MWRTLDRRVSAYDSPMRMTVSTRWRLAVASAVLLAVALPVASGAAAATRVHKVAVTVPGTIAIGDSVLLDAQGVLEQIMPGIDVDAVVSRQFSAGVPIVESLRASHHLTDRFVVFLGTNGWISHSDFQTMLDELSVCGRVVLVTNWVPTRGWMAANNALIESGAKAHNVVIANWAALAQTHPGWFYSDEVHLPIDGPGATALAHLIASALTQRTR